METCTSCGHRLGVGRFCLNCGKPVDPPPVNSPSAPPEDDWRTSTAERPAAPSPASAQPPVVGPPTQARYPLYADEASAPPAAPLPTPPPPGPPPGRSPAPRAHRAPRPWLPWLAVGLTLVLVAAVGLSLLLRGGADDDDEQAADRAPRRAEATPSPEPSPSSTGRDEPSPTKSPTPTAKSSRPSESKSKPPTPDPEDVATQAMAVVPATAPPNQDVDGNLVSYGAANMLDAVPETCWRMPGDGTGSELVYELAEPVRLSRIGLINGYAKTSSSAGTLNWYTGNRRILGVEWVFDDGTTVSQSLVETRRMQAIDIDPVRTSTVLLRIVSVTAPGDGRARRDYTAISDVTLVGTPG